MPCSLRHLPPGAVLPVPHTLRSLGGEGASVQGSCGLGWPDPHCSGIGLIAIPTFRLCWDSGSLGPEGSGVKLLLKGQHPSRSDRLVGVPAASLPLQLLAEEPGKAAEAGPRVGSLLLK